MSAMALHHLRPQTVNQGVVGSSPTSGAKFYQGLAEMQGLFFWPACKPLCESIPLSQRIHHVLSVVLQPVIESVLNMQDCSL